MDLTFCIDGSCAFLIREWCPQNHTVFSKQMDIIRQFQLNIFILSDRYHTAIKTLNSRSKEIKLDKLSSLVLIQNLLSALGIYSSDLSYLNENCDLPTQ